MNNDIEENFENKILWYNFVLCIFVVCIHAQNMYIFIEAVTWINQLMSSFIEKITCLAVPGFFMCSGYLLYRNLMWNKIPTKMKRRIFSLIIPFLVWNFLYYILYIVSQRIPYFGQLFDTVVPFSLKELINSVFFYKYNPVFWFMLYLILFSFLCPLFYGLLKQKWVGLFVVILIYISNFSTLLTSYLPLNMRDILVWSIYYLLGSYMSIHFKEFIMPDKKQLFVCIFFISACTSFVLSFVCNKNEWLSLYKICGAAFIWYFIWMIDLPKARNWMKNTFFIYAVHQIMSLFINKISNLFFGNSMYIGGLVFLAIPVIVVTFSYYTEMLLSKYFPIIWRILSGGR